MKKIKIDEYKVAIAIILAVSGLLMFGQYKWQEYKLEHIWGVKNPSFFQVWDLMRHNKRK